jgi:hypothetical protein
MQAKDRWPLRLGVPIKNINAFQMSPCMISFHIFHGLFPQVWLGSTLLAVLDVPFARKDSIDDIISPVILNPNAFFEMRFRIFIRSNNWIEA